LFSYVIKTTENDVIAIERNNRKKKAFPGNELPRSYSMGRRKTEISKVVSHWLKFVINTLQVVDACTVNTSMKRLSIWLSLKKCVITKVLSV